MKKKSLCNLDYFIERKWIILITDDTKQKILNLKKIRLLTERIIRDFDTINLPLEIKEISILFTEDRLMKKLNFNYRNKNKTTDVLSFPQLGGLKSHSTSIGDIVINVKQAKRQFKKYTTSFNNEVIRLLIHGILHLFSYDHENVAAAEISKMRTAENLLFRLYSKTKIL